MLTIVVCVLFVLCWLVCGTTATCAALAVIAVFWIGISAVPGPTDRALRTSRRPLDEVDRIGYSGGVSTGDSGR